MLGRARATIVLSRADMKRDKPRAETATHRRGRGDASPERFCAIDMSQTWDTGGLRPSPIRRRVYGHAFRTTRILHSNVWTQDRAYVDLMRELWGSPERWNARRSYVDVARKLGVDEETVRNRIKRLKESGYLKGWRVLPNPTVFGRESRMVYLGLGDSREKESRLSELRQIDGVVVVASVYGKGAIVTFFDDAAHVASKKIAEVGVPGTSLGIGEMRFQPTDFRMTQTDWQIVSLMLKDAERDIREVAREAKLSSRTVKRRLNRMMDSSAIAIMPMIDQSKAGGASYTFMIECEEGRMREVERAVSGKLGNLGFKARYSDRGLIFGFIARNVPEGNEFQRWAEAQSGVKSITANLVDEVVYAFDWLATEARNRGTASHRGETVGV
jgi:DNA-binding Lrp family transcriptional regulator